MNKPISYSLIIATFERPSDLVITFSSLMQQRRKPLEVIVVDSSRDYATQGLCAEWEERLPLRYHRSKRRSAAKQRNEGAEMSKPDAEVLGFMDDDITTYPETFEKVCLVFDEDKQGKVGGIAVRIDEIERTPPSGLTRAYYRLQSGYDHPTYGGHLFGPAINCLPCYTPEEFTYSAHPDMVPSSWLNSGCVFYRRNLFLQERFPEFEGYSFMEDVHLSARIGQKAELYFHSKARCSHREGTNMLKRDYLGLARQRIRNQRLVARDVMGKSGLIAGGQFFLHRLFVSLVALGQRGPGWKDDLRGTWS